MLKLVFLSFTKNNKLRRKNSTQRQHNIKVVNFVSMVHISSHINVYYLRIFFFNDPSPSFYLRWGPEDLIICFGVIWLSDKICPRTEAINKLPRLGPYHQLKWENINVTQENILLQPQHMNKWITGSYNRAKASILLRIHLSLPKLQSPQRNMAR